MLALSGAHIEQRCSSRTRRQCLSPQLPRKLTWNLESRTFPIHRKPGDHPNRGPCLPRPLGHEVQAETTSQSKTCPSAQNRVKMDRDRSFADPFVWNLAPFLTFEANFGNDAQLEPTSARTSAHDKKKSGPVERDRSRGGGGPAIARSRQEQDRRRSFDDARRISRRVAGGEGNVSLSFELPRDVTRRVASRRERPESARS